MDAFTYNSLDELKDNILNKKYISLTSFYDQLSEKHKNNKNRYDMYNNKKGIITAAGGRDLLLQSFVSINLLRYHGCNLPVELYYADEDEMNTVTLKDTNDWIMRTVISDSRISDNKHWSSQAVAYSEN